MWRTVFSVTRNESYAMCNACAIRYKKYGFVCHHCLYVPFKKEVTAAVLNPYTTVVCKRCTAQLPSQVPEFQRRNRPAQAFV